MRTRRPAAVRPDGGYTFAERPEVEAPDARIIWRADMDPGTLRAAASPVAGGHPDAVDPRALRPWLSIVADDEGEHAVLSDGRHRIRIDLAEGSLAAGHPVVLEYHLKGIASAMPRILPLRRLLDLYRHRRFSVSLYPRDRRVERWLLALRVHDAMRAGASQREIVRVLFGDDSAQLVGNDRADSIRSRVRRLAGEARRLAGGGYRSLMRQRQR
ncbi:DNA -binding domain-containing protein [Sphingomonas koreensis]